MTNYLSLSIDKIHEKLQTKEISPLVLVEECFAKIENNQDLNALITLNKEEALKQARALENQAVDNLLFGLPIVLKDNIITKDLRTTCGSKMLENFIPIYDATVVEKLRERHMIVVGKANMDEFAMGSTSQTSYFKAPRNPWNKQKVTGGSSGGSAAAVASGMVPFALGSDTGGSVRQPASYCGIVGMKPTYGRVSRYGLVAFGSSLDQIGPMTRNVYENAILLNAITGLDEKDMTSVDRVKEDYTRLIGKEIKGMKIGVVNYFMSDIVALEIREQIERVISLLQAAGAVIETIDIDYIEQAATLYQIIAMAEASSNLARFDGIRYGYRTKSDATVEEMYCKTRAEGFGDEVKRRIMVGSYILSGENAKTYYNKALQIRDDIQKSFLKAFEEYDLIIGPTTTTTAGNIGEGVDDPKKTFLDDVLVIPANMAGLPAMSVPIGFDQEHLPIGLHIIGAPFKEDQIYQLGAFVEKTLKLDLACKVGEIDA